MEDISFFWIFLIIVTCGFGAILYLLVTHGDRKEEKRRDSDEQDVEIVPSPQTNPLRGLTERQKGILEYIREKKEAKPQELRNIAGNVSERTVRRDMNVLVERGLVSQEGTTKSTYYRHIEK